MSCKYSNKKVGNIKRKRILCVVHNCIYCCLCSIFYNCSVKSWFPINKSTSFVLIRKKHKLLKCLTRHKNREQVLSIHKSCTILEVWAKKPDQKLTAYYQIYPWHLYDYYILCPLAKSVTVFVKRTSLKAAKTCL